MDRWFGLVLVCMVGLSAGKPATAEEKSPVAAGVLSGLVGFGAGHYYAAEPNKGIIFTATDLGLVIGAAIAHSNDEDGLATGLWLGLLGVRIYQTIDGIDAAHRYNKRHGFGFLDYSKPNFGMSFSSSVFGDYRSDRFADLWAEGGASRDMALAYKRTREFKSPWSLDLAVADLGVGCSWNGTF